MKRILHILLLTALTICVRAQLHVSILTCSPGEEVYAKFGHTAVRVWDESSLTKGFPFDIVFHYGVFDYETPDFVGRFVRGETDYSLGAVPTMEFYCFYRAMGREIYEQELNLTEEQAASFLLAIEDNYKPENRVYRYNFVFDNCATRPYQLLLATLPDSLHAPAFAKRSSSFRQVISYYTHTNSWEQFGIDLCFGKDADREMTPEERLFLPEEFMDLLSEASVDGKKFVIRDGAKKFKVIPATNFFLSPAMALILMLLVALVVFGYDYKKRKMSFGFDRCLYFLWGLIGCVLLYLSIWSQHPFVSSNYNLLFFNPLWLVLFGLTLYSKGRRMVRRLQLPILLYTTVAFLVYLFSNQHMHMFVAASAGFLLIRSFLGFQLRHESHVHVAHHHRHHHHHHAVLLALLLCSASAIAESKLVVFAVVDGLNSTVLSRVSRSWNGGAFQTMTGGGCSYESVYFPQMTHGGIESVVALLTGSTASVNGICANTVYDPRTKQARLVLEDPNQAAIGTALHLSPKAIINRTISDQVRLQNRDARIFSVGLEGQETVALAGHSANAAFWLDPLQYQWVAAGYYNEGLPSEAAHQNADSTLILLSQSIWSPLYDNFDYYCVKSQREKNDGGFSYLPTYRANTYSHTYMTRTPAANQAVLDMGLALQASRHLGEEYTDMLMLQLTVKSPNVASDYLYSAEQEDMYARLNKQLQTFIEQLESRLGHDHYLLVVVGRPVMDYDPNQLKEAKLKTADFDVDRCGALLNLYLMAKYGQEDWVCGVHGNHVYLNQRLIESKKIAFDEIESDVARFMKEFEGVRVAYSAEDLPLIVAEEEGDLTPLHLKNAHNKVFGGQVVYALQSGWRILNSDGSPYDNILETNPLVPCFLYGGEVPRKKITQSTSSSEVYKQIKSVLYLP